MRIADAALKYLEKIGIEYIFGISAGTVSALCDAVNDTNIRLIITKNEAGAAYSAARYANISKKLGVCIGAGGVGVNNMINGIADAMRSKVPVLVLSGYIPRSQIGKGAVQELDTQNILKPITKYSKTVLHEKQILNELHRAVDMALTPPYGPVHLSIPIDVQILEAKNDYVFEDILDEVSATVENITEYNFKQIERAIEIINKEEFGIIMVGKGCRGFSEEIKELSKHLNWPIITTPQGKGVISTDFELNLGNYGFASTDAALDYAENENITCMLVLGSSLGESATRTYNDILVKNRKLIHIDWDRNELNKVFNADAAVCCDLKIAISEIIENTNKKNIRFNRYKLMNSKYEENHTGLSVRLFLEKIVDILPSNTCFISDIGEYMNFLFKYLPIKDGMDFEININYGAMGSGIGGAIGAHLAAQNRQIAVFVGDGSFYMNGSEILTAKEYKMPIIYFIINNSMLGYVEHGHKYLYGRTIKGFVQERISIAKITESMGIKSMYISNINQMSEIKDFISDLDGPCVIELITDGSEKVPISERFKTLSNEI